jgi:hypothetical protein
VAEGDRSVHSAAKPACSYGRRAVQDTNCVLHERKLQRPSDSLHLTPHTLVELLKVAGCQEHPCADTQHHQS